MLGRLILALTSAALLVSTQAQQSEDAAVAAILGSTNGLIFNGHFTDAPTTAVNYQHLPFDSADNAVTQTKHRGLLKFAGTATSYLDLSATTGANSYNGLTLPQFGGAGSRTGNEQGVSFEMVVKFNQDRQWAKTFDFSTGPGSDELTLTLDGNDDGAPRVLVEQYLNRTTSGVTNNYDKATLEVFRPALDVWYHIAIVMKPAPNSMVAGPSYGSGLWYMYVNGQKLALADQISAGAAFTPIQAANYPMNIVRPFQYLSRSAWAADPNLAQTVDAFRVYSYALSDTVISGLAGYYGLLDAANPINTPANNPAMPASPEANKHMTSAINFNPVYTLDFGVNPTQYVGGAINYEWAEFDTRDSAVDQQNHRGIARFTGASNSFIDMMNPAGPNSAGKVMPTLFGASSGTGESNGWTIDMVVKPMAVQTWAKYFSLGTAQELDSLYVGWLGGDNLWEAGNYNNLRDDLNVVRPGHATFFKAPTLRKWQHIAMVMRPIDQAAHPKSTYAGNWTLFVNGQRVTSAVIDINYPVPIVRRQSFLGASNWPADPKANMTVDVFRVWDRALDGAQVESLSVAYGIAALDGGDYNWELAMNATGNPWPIYSLDFQQNPTQNGGDAPTGWTWSEQDPTDPTLIAGSHTGLATMTGAESSFMNLTAASGPNRAYEGMVLPQPIGGPTTPPNGLQSGWSIETVFKVTAWNPHAKIFALSDARDSDEILLGFDNAGDNLLFQNLMNQTGTDYEDGEVEITRPTVLGKWYHIVISMFPVDANTNAGNWQIWVNGQLQNWATQIVPDMTFTAIQGASFPRSRRRSNAFLGKSTWADANARVVYDAFHIYNYIMTPQMVRSFANAYGCLENNPTPTPANNQPIPSSTETTNYVSAGIQTAPAFNGVFSSNPASFVGGRTDYQWLEYDSADSAANQALHRGLIRLNGSDVSYVDLAVATGPKSVGLVAPILGASGQLTIECVVKLGAVGDWQKLLQFANGPSKDSVLIGWNGARGLEVHNRNSVRRGLPTIGVAAFMPAPVVGQWYHIAVVMERLNQDRYDANWKIYVNGELRMEHTPSAPIDGATYPMPLYRQYAAIGKSAWEDPNINMLVDMVRIHQSALTLAQVRGTAQAYGLYGETPGVPPTDVSLPQADTDESRAVAAIVGTAPVFNAFFGTNPTSAVQVTALEWEWVEFHSADDAAQRAFHKGLARVGQRPEGQPAKYIDVTTNIGPNSCGQVLPRIGGPSSKSGAENGWTFEIVFKLTERIAWSKIFDFGAGSGQDNIVFGVDGDDVDTLAFEVWNDGPQAAYGKASSEVMPAQLNTWYHVVIMVEPVNAALGSANWYFYVNGGLLAYANAIVTGTSFTSLQGAGYPQPDPRTQAYLGRSSWRADTPSELYIDAMRVYDYRLTPAKITQLAALYGCTNQIRIATPADDKNVNGGNDAEITMWDRASIRRPVYNANFAVDPRGQVGGVTRYTWMAVDSNDTATEQARHRGLIYLDGTETSFVDLMSASGPNSVGLVMPTLFGASSGSGAARGWTIELVAKLKSKVNSYAKLINLANGGKSYFDSWAISWRENELVVENVNNVNYNLVPRRDGTFKQLFNPKPEMFKWMHITVVMQPADPLSSYTATWTTYVDGYVVAVSNASLATMPTAVVRDNSFLGASQYGRNDGFQPMWVDALRVYDFALSSEQVGAMAQAYGSDVYVPSSSSSKLSDGAIAGAVVGSIVGAILLGVILFCFCCSGATRSAKKSTDSHDHDMGNTGYGEVEVSQQSHVNDDEVEMQETA